MKSTAALVFAALAATATAQTTWIVDANGGPGTSFTQLPPAVAAASSGDVIVVRPGAYSGFSTSKGLSVLGEAGVSISSAAFFAPVIEVTGLPSGEVFVLADASLTFGVSQQGISLRDTAGNVHLQDVAIQGYQGVGVGGGAGLRVASAATVTVTGGSITGGVPAVDATDSDVTVAGTPLHGADSMQSFGGSLTASGPALHASGGRVAISRSTMLGGSGNVGTFGTEVQPSEPAIVATNATLVVTGLSGQQVHAGSFSPTGPVPGVRAEGGSLLFDSLLDVRGAGGGPAFAGTAPLEQRRVVSFLATGGQLGGRVDAEIASSPGDLVAIFVGASTPSTPSPFGPVYVDLRTAIPLAFLAVQPAGGLLARGFGVPALPALTGAVLALQGANFDPAAARLEMSNATVIALR